MSEPAASLAAPESAKLLRQKNRALHRELHKLRVDVRYLTTALAARDGQLSMLTKRARVLEETLQALAGGGPVTLSLGPVREGERATP